jgi:hypothetical protein
MAPTPGQPVSIDAGSAALAAHDVWDVEPESSQHFAASQARRSEDSTVDLPSDPFPFEHEGEKRCPDRAADMTSSLTPVQAGEREPPRRSVAVRQVVGSSSLD